MSTEWHFSELTALDETLAGVEGRVNPAVAKSIKEGGEAIAKRAKTIAPRRTGKLRRSIGSTFTEKAGSTEARAEIGATAPYGGFVEHGTARMSPRPYMAPAAEAETPGVVAAISKAGMESLQ